MPIKQAPFRPKEKKSLVDIVNTGLGIAKTAGGIAGDASSLFGGESGSGIVDSSAWNRPSLGVDMSSLDKFTRRMRGKYGN